MKKLLIILLLACTSGVYAQTAYYSTDGANRITKEELQKMQTGLKAQYSKALNREMFVNIQVKSTQKKKDSIIHRISFAINDKKSNSKAKKGPFDDLKNKEFPAFNLKTLSNENFDLTKLKGKPTLINFWFTKCAPCVAEMRPLNKIAEKYKDEINFIAITYESPKNVKKFLKKHPFKFKHLVNAQAFIDQLGIHSYPVNVFLDDKGVLKYVEGGIAYEKNEKGEFKMGKGEGIIKLLEKLKK